MAGEVVDHNGVHVVGMANPPSGMPTHASFLFARNVANVLGLMGPEGTLAPDWDDEIVAGMCVLRDGASGGAGRGGAAGRDTGHGAQWSTVVIHLLAGDPDAGRRPGSSST